MLDLAEVLEQEQNKNPEQKKENSKKEKTFTSQTKNISIPNKKKKIELIEEKKKRGTQANIYLNANILEFLEKIKTDNNIKNNSQAIIKIILTFKEMIKNNQT